MADAQTPLNGLRAHLDLGAPPDAADDAWGEADRPERLRLLDDCLLEALLADTLQAAPPMGVARHTPRRPIGWPLAAAIVILAVGAGILLWPRYPQPRARGDLRVVNEAGEFVPQGRVRRGDRVLAGPRGAGLDLGDYCVLELGADAELVVRGGRRRESVLLERGKLLSRVSSDKGLYTVLTPLGSLDVVGTEFRASVEYLEAEGGNTMRRSIVVTAAVISGIVAYQFGDESGRLTAGMSRVFSSAAAAETGPAKGTIEAGKPTYRSRTHEAWRERGRIVGRMRNCPGCEIDVLDGAGKIVKSTRCPKGAKAYELQWLAPGTYSLRVAARGYESLVLEGLVVKAKNDLFVDLEFTGGSGSDTIAHSKPVYKPKNHPAWAEKGRVVGLLRNCPGCEIDALDAEGRVVKSARVPKGGKVYELEWLAPGAYTIRVAAKGYKPLVLEGIVIKAKNDTWISFEF